ncbi:MAG: hypothetical protein OEZ13_03165 [Spirochaetia bacterium]|nr:hypothetical protein [Spirochaetia bacterium]
MKYINYRYLILLISFCFPFINCARFKVEKLKAEKIFSVPMGAKGISFPNQQGVYHEIPLRIGVVDDKLIAPEPSNKLIKIFNNEKLELIIISKEQHEKNIKDQKTEPDKSVKIIAVENLNIPGIITGGVDSDFYVLSFYTEALSQNTDKKGENLSSNANESGEENTEQKISLQSTGGSLGFYKILHFDLNGNLLGIIGREGKPELPFESVLWMDVDNDKNFWVLYNDLEDIRLEKHVEGKLFKYFEAKQCESIVFDKISKKEKELFSCENMYPFPSGDKVIFVGKIEELPDLKSGEPEGYIFQKRIFVLHDLKTGKNTVIFKNLNDPEDYPYLPYENYITLWQFQKHNQTKVALYNLEGDLIKNLQINLEGPRHTWRSTYLTLSSGFYSIRVIENKFTVYRWQ